MIPLRRWFWPFALGWRKDPATGPSLATLREIHAQDVAMFSADDNDQKIPKR